MDNTVNPTLIALISVITTGLVSVLSIFVPLIIESIRSRQTSISAERDKVDSATLDFLREISHFRSPVQNDIQNSSNRPFQQAVSDMQIKHYAWERAVWNKLEKDHHEKVIAIRKRIETIHHNNLGGFAKDLPNLTDEILTLSRIASKRI